MKQISLLAVLIICLFFLGACSVEGDAAELYKQQTPLQVEVNLPESLSSDEEVVLEAVLRQQGELVADASFVHFEILKQDGSIHFPMEEATALGNGTYQMKARFENDGLYYLEVHAGNNGSLVSPQYQFVVGKLSDQELKSLKQGPAPTEEVPGHHH